MTQKEREEGASHTLLTVRSTPFAPTKYPIIAPPYSCLLIDFFYGFRITDTDLQKITKTEVVGLQKLKWLIFDCCRKTNHLRYIWTDPLGLFKCIVSDLFFYNNQKSATSVFVIPTSVLVISCKFVSSIKEINHLRSKGMSRAAL